MAGRRHPVPSLRFPIEPWAVREPQLDLDSLAQTESIFALSNGHVGVRGNLDEAEPHALLGSYLNSFYEVRPLPYAESAYGYPEAGQTVVNVTDGKVIRLLVDDEPFDIRYGSLLRHERVLDLRAGVLRRSVEWRSPAGGTVLVRSTRLVSFVARAILGVEYEVEATDAAVSIVVQSELVANEPTPAQSNDPRTAAALESPLVSVQYVAGERGAVLMHSTRRSEQRIAVAMDHIVEAPPGARTLTESSADLGRTTVAARLEPGQKLRVRKLVAYGWSSQRSFPALRAQVEGALAGARQRGWQGLLMDQREYLDAFWDRADVEIEGDNRLQQAVRFGLFHLLQSGARAERRAIPAKGLTGPGYDGHTFWDTEMFVLQVLTYTVPEAAADALRWRQSILGLAKERAKVLDLEGAAFPWRTIRGEECSGYWPASTAAVHINADIANAVTRYSIAACDEQFDREVGVELLVETARLWRSLGHYDLEGGFRIDGVTGPDEYSALSNNNTYTNLMAQSNLRRAADAVERYPDVAERLGATTEEITGWRAAADAVVVPYDEALGVHQQANGFTRLQEWDFSKTSPSDYPLLLHFPYFELYRRQVIKQADLVLAMHLRGDAFSVEQKARNFDYYEQRTVRDSSLSACTQAVMAAEVGHLELACDYLYEAALIDLADIEHNVADGLHMASLAGSWIATVAGFGGFRDHSEVLCFSPQLPTRLSGITFRISFRGRRIRVAIKRDVTTYSLQGPALKIAHHGDGVMLMPDRDVQLFNPTPPERPPVKQPVGREPRRRG